MPDKLFIGYRSEVLDCKQCFTVLIVSRDELTVGEAVEKINSKLPEKEHFKVKGIGDGETFPL